MGLKALLAFAPFLAFALIEKLVGIVTGLAAGFAVSLALVVWEGVRHRPFNSLEVGSGLIFGGLTLLALRGAPSWSVWQVRLYVDGGLAFMVLLGVLVGRPFTAQHALKATPADAARDPLFRQRNAILSGVWGSRLSVWPGSILA